MEEIIYNPFAGVYKRAVELYLNKEYQEAFIKFFSVVENDRENYHASFYLGECYFYGYGTEQNYDKAFPCYMTAAVKHEVEAVYKIGLSYEKGYGVEIDETQAVSWYMEAAKTDHTEAEYHLGLCYKLGKGIEQNYPLAARWLLRAAQKGVVDAQKQAAECYKVLNQPLAAATLYLAAAENNDSYSCYKIANFYADGYGCPKSIDLALEFFKKSANLGYIEAMLALADRYKFGNGLEKSIQNAIYWWLKASDKNDRAQIELAECYLEGNGVLRDIDQAMQWFGKAANNNNVEAMMRLADLSLNPPKGYDKDEVGAKIWFSKAAALGSSEAMYKLGLCYEDAIGSANPNYNEAYRWYRLASLNGYEAATEACKRFSKSMFGTIKRKK